MDNLTKIYTKGVHEDLVFYYAQWLPTENMKIGVVGTLEGSFLSGKYLFRPLTTLSDLGIPFSPDDDILPDNDPASLDYKSKNGVKFISKVAGEATIAGLPNIPKGKAGIGYEFAKEGGYVLKAKEVYEPRIRDVISLQKRILKSYEQGHWQKNFAVVYSVLQAAHADMLVSRASSSKIEFEVQGDAVVGPVELGSAEIEFTRKSESGSVMDLRNSKNVTPLFKLAGLKSRWFADDEVGALKVNNRITPSTIRSADINQEHLYLDILRSDRDRPKSIIMFE